MNDPYDARDNRVRVGDADRDRAIGVLGVHFSDGRLSVTEYDERCRAVAGALTRAEIDAQFTDLPALPAAQAGPVGDGVAVYSATEIAEQHRRGANPRAGIMMLTTVAGVAAAVIIGGTAAVVPVAVIAAVAVLLYVVKPGPDSWYVPSPGALERARVRKLRQAHQLELEEKKARRRLIQAEITTDAMDLAHRAIGRVGRKPGGGQGRSRKGR